VHFPAAPLLIKGGFDCASDGSFPLFLWQIGFPSSDDGPPLCLAYPNPQKVCQEYSEADALPPPLSLYAGIIAVGLAFSPDLYDLRGEIAGPFL